MALIFEYVLDLNTFEYVLDVTKISIQEPFESFWIIAKAIQRFHEKHHQLPLPGGLPDMKALSNVYVELQAIYRSKSKQDVDEVMDFIRAIPGGSQVARDEVELFCKNARFVKLLQGPHNEPSTRQIIRK